jgi:hypothetical protein
MGKPMNDVMALDVAGADEDWDIRAVLIEGMAGTDTTRGRAGITGTVGAGVNSNDFPRSLRTVEGEFTSSEARLAVSSHASAGAKAASATSCGVFKGAAWVGGDCV